MRSHLNGFEILIIFYIFHDCIRKFQIEIQFFIELHGNSKLSMTSCPPSSDWTHDHKVERSVPNTTFSRCTETLSKSLYVPCSCLPILKWVPICKHTGKVKQTRLCVEVNPHGFFEKFCTWMNPPAWPDFEFLTLAISVFAPIYHPPIPISFKKINFAQVGYFHDNLLLYTQLNVNEKSPIAIPKFAKENIRSAYTMSIWERPPQTEPLSTKKQQQQKQQTNKQLTNKQKTESGPNAKERDMGTPAETLELRLLLYFIKRLAKIKQTSLDLLSLG